MSNLIRTEKLSDGQPVFRAYDFDGRMLYQWVVWRKRSSRGTYYHNDTVTGTWETKAAMKLAFTEHAIRALDSIA